MTSVTEISETDFLKSEADKAKASLVQSLKDATSALTHSVDPVAAARRHPLITIGSAAVVAFTATIAAIPSKHERELRRLERLHLMLHPQPVSKARPVPESTTSGNGSHRTAAPPMWAMFAKEAIGLIKPILIAQITSKIKTEANTRHGENMQTSNL